ncbi:MAG: rod-binding protein [Spirochaetia bacterium]|nr:rod-binding protein [Spirochaetia bacterium]
MNLNTMDPLLYNGKDSLNTNTILNYEKLKDKADLKSKTTSNFLEELNESIHKAIPENYRNKVSSDILDRGMKRKDILSETSASPEKRKLYEASKEFESFFVEKMFIEMKKNVPKNPMFHGGYAEDLFDDMLLSERVRKLSNNTEFGLAEKIYQQLSRTYS